jgi:hypothetical protein
MFILREGCITAVALDRRQIHFQQFKSNHPCINRKQITNTSYIQQHNQISNIIKICTLPKHTTRTAQNVNQIYMNQKNKSDTDAKI